MNTGSAETFCCTDRWIIRQCTNWDRRQIVALIAQQLWRSTIEDKILRFSSIDLEQHELLTKPLDVYIKYENSLFGNSRGHDHCL